MDNLFLPYANSCWLAQLQEETIGWRIGIHRDALTFNAPIFAAVRLQVDKTLLGALHENGLVGGLVALELEIARRAIANKSLLTLEYQNWPKRIEHNENLR